MLGMNKDVQPIQYRQSRFNTNNEYVMQQFHVDKQEESRGEIVAIESSRESIQPIRGLVSGHNGLPTLGVVLTRLYGSESLCGAKGEHGSVPLTESCNAPGLIKKWGEKWDEEVTHVYKSSGEGNIKV